MRTGLCPWGDMEEEMRKEGLPLYALESGDPVAEFDLIGFSLGYEMAYTNVLNMLNLAGLPLRAKDRPALTPLVVAGGTSMYNPEPLAPFCGHRLPGRGRGGDRGADSALSESKGRGMVQAADAAGSGADSRAVYSLTL